MRNTLSKCIILSVALILCGCKGGKRPAPPRGVLVSDAKFAPNPKGKLGDDSQKLKYPPGIDTQVYWLDGQYAVVGNILYDNSKKSAENVIFEGVVGYRQVEHIVLLKGKNEVGILDLKNKDFSLADSKLKESPPSE